MWAAAWGALAAVAKAGLTAPKRVGVAAAGRRVLSLRAGTPRPHRERPGGPPSRRAVFSAWRKKWLPYGGKSHTRSSNALGRSYRFQPQVDDDPSHDTR